MTWRLTLAAQPIRSQEGSATCRTHLVQIAVLLTDFCMRILVTRSKPVEVVSQLCAEFAKVECLDYEMHLCYSVELVPDVGVRAQVQN